ncbi:MAG: cytochrome-c peroxidase [Thermosulfidibacteraceae bacterium]|jgi:cytochrome c peroxidase
MKKKAKLLLALTCGLALMGMANQDDSKLLEEARKYFEPLPKVVDIKENPVTPEKIKLGKLLYYDPRLSKSGLISCNTCHNIASYGVDNLPTSIGHRWQIGPRNAPTTLNAALHVAQFWDGRAKDVEEQAKGPILNPIEMAMDSPEEVIKRVSSIPEYVEFFKRAFPNDKNPVNYENLAKAIGAFERTLVTPSRFDKFLKGDISALTPEEKAGLREFIKAGCASCHNGPAIGGTMFTKFGIVESYWEATRDFVTLDKPTMTMDVGKFAVTQKKEDLYVFKVPSLRNISRTYPYFHDGSVWDLKAAVQIMARVQLGSELEKDKLEKIVAFLKALDGEIPKDALEMPILPPSTSKTPTPLR